ncbi:hypothetical protein [Sphingomonas sp. IC4-52]|uniref:hypothetical protein n=1 Tax=Sphingomonas sp. IC4-52 TaxID=2887202 RepID=UPI001D11608C|nr:hypothetical protein [Sphingomonas sp. IC4-52]MCC2979776.1 hypothetical protein [Sphingomonas sp. IC4-52]
MTKQAIAPRPISDTSANLKRSLPLFDLLQRARPAARRRIDEVRQLIWANLPVWQPPGRPHGLASELIVSVTSYPRRFRSLHYTLRSLLEQDVKADRTILWIAERDRDAIPRAVWALRDRGLEIRFSADIRSYKKLVPALEAFPHAFIATADDDIIYPPDWLGVLVDGYSPVDPSIVCRRAHRIGFDTEGFKPYLAWELNLNDGSAFEPADDLLAVGAGGVLYPPGALHADVLRADMFMQLAPQGDDLWFWWMGRRLGTKTRCAGEMKEYRYVVGTQAVALWGENSTGGNDRQLAALVSAFGYDQVKPGGPDRAPARL